MGRIRREREGLKFGDKRKATVLELEGPSEAGMVLDGFIT